MPSPSGRRHRYRQQTRSSFLVVARDPAGRLQTLTSETIDARISAGIGQAEPA